MDVLKNNRQNIDFKSFCYINTCNDEIDPYVSFIIPTFNRTEKLKCAVLSIANQEYNYKYEIIIMDNSEKKCESNENYEMLQKLNVQHLKYYINQVNLGPTGNWNRGIELAQGQYVAFLHDDDLLNNNYGLATYNALKRGEKRGKLGFIIPQYEKFSNEEEINSSIYSIATGKIRDIRKIDSLIVGCGPTQTPTCGMIFNRKAIIDVGGFEAEYHPSDDHLLGYRILAEGYKGYQIKDIIAYYRLDEENETWNKDVQIGFVIKDFAIREIMYNDANLPRIIKNFLSKACYSEQVDLWLNVANIKNINIGFDDINVKPEYYEKNIYRLLYLIILVIFKILRKMRLYH